MCLTLALTFTGCFDDGDVSSADPTPTVSPSVSPSTSPSTEPTPDASMDESMVSDDMSSAKGEGLDAYAKTVKDTYAADYIPDRKLTDSEVQEKLGLSTELYDDIYAEGSTLAENPDIFVAVKAKSGKAADVEKKLKEYRDNLSTDTAFTANADKIKAGEVFTNGDHVFLMILGANEFADAGENIADRFADEMKKGADAIKRMFD